MAKEQRWREGHPPCDNNCGPHDGQADAAAATCAASSCCSASSPSFSTCTADSGEAAAAARGAVAETAAGGSIREVEAARRRRGCARCGRRVGLTGFACRCGATFCAAHRYPERHACGYDYKAAGREAIARSNPVVKADKLPHKI